MNNTELVEMISEWNEARHKHIAYRINLKLGQGKVLKNFLVEEGVFRPDVTSGISFAKALIRHKELFEGKRVLSYGCGTGIDGISIAKFCNAAFVYFYDTSVNAVRNAKKNVKTFGIEKMTTVSDIPLEEQLGDTSPFSSYIAVFNHPFFHFIPNPKLPVSASWNGGTKSIHEFLEEAKKYSGIVMPYWKPAGAWNDPSVQGPRHGYRIVEIDQTKMPQDMRDNVLHIYHLRKSRKKVFV